MQPGEVDAPPSLIYPEAIKSQACRATVDIPRSSDHDSDDDEGDDDDVPEKMWVTIGLSRVRQFVPAYTQLLTG